MKIVQYKCTWLPLSGGKVSFLKTTWEKWFIPIWRKSNLLLKLEVPSPPLLLLTVLWRSQRSQTQSAHKEKKPLNLHLVESPQDIFLTKNKNNFRPMTSFVHLARVFCVTCERKSITRWFKENKFLKKRCFIVAEVMKWKKKIHRDWVKFKIVLIRVQLCSFTHVKLHNNNKTGGQITRLRAAYLQINVCY